jgi:hypothetical protein
MTPYTRNRARKLLGQWKDRLEEMREDDSDVNIQLEQEAHDELVDFIEANDLNGSEFDPRGRDN